MNLRALRAPLSAEQRLAVTAAGIGGAVAVTALFIVFLVSVDKLIEHKEARFAEHVHEQEHRRETTHSAP